MVTQQAVSKRLCLTLSGLLLLSSVVRAREKAEPAAFVLLRPDEPLASERIEPGGSEEDSGTNDYSGIDGRLYALCGLQPSTDYELRVSYPATSAADFSLDFVGRRPGSGASRRLLNTEKLMFVTDEAGRVPGVEPRPVGRPDEPDCYIVRVTARYAGRSHLPDAATRPVLYNIVLESLLPGGVPYSVLPLATFVAVGAVVIGTVLVPQLLPFLHHLARPQRPPVASSKRLA